MFKGYSLCAVIIILSLITHTILGVIVLHGNWSALTLQCQSSLFPYQIVMTIISAIIMLIIIYVITYTKTYHSVNFEFGAHCLRFVVIILLALVGWSLFIHTDLKYCQSNYENIYPYYLKFFYVTFWYYIALTLVLFCICVYFNLKHYWVRNESDFPKSNKASKETSCVGNSEIRRVDYYQSCDAVSTLQPQMSLDGIPIGFVDVDLN